MARYTGPKRKLERRENATLFGSESWKKRAFPPGQHTSSRGRMSSYAIQFREKQKVKRIYGLLEKQFRRFYSKAVKMKGNTGLNLLQLLELRLDNIVYRCGLAKTRMQSRQMVTHGHVMLNGKKVDICSYIVKPGDEVELNPKAQKSELIKLVRAELGNYQFPKWITPLSFGGTVKSIPTRDDIDRSIKEQYIVELYSR